MNHASASASERVGFLNALREITARRPAKRLGKHNRRDGAAFACIRLLGAYERTQ